MWTTNTARRKFDMFPKFVSMDDTEGTNIEDRPLNDWCSKDGNNKLYPFMFSYLPSKSQWAYTFVCRAAPVLHPGTALQRVVKVNSDADKQETRAIRNAIGKNKKMYTVQRVAPSEENHDFMLPMYKKRLLADPPHHSYHH